jgi:putative tricarboxylic transport membrane protein
MTPWQRLGGSKAGRRDLALALAITVFSIVLYRQADLLPPPFFDPLGSAAVPKATAIVLVVLAACLLVQRAFHLEGGGMSMPARPADGEQEVPPAPFTALGAIALPVAYIAVLQAGWLSFPEASALFVMALGALFGQGRRAVLLALPVIALVTGYGLNHIFTEILYVDLPQRSLLSGG